MYRRKGAQSVTFKGRGVLIFWFKLTVGGKGYYFGWNLEKNSVYTTFLSLYTMYLNVLICTKNNFNTVTSTSNIKI